VERGEYEGNDNSHRVESSHDEAIANQEHYLIISKKLALQNLYSAMSSPAIICT
jgi:hypothetical protein